METMITLEVWLVLIMLVLLPAFGYAAACCREEGRRCETWRDGVRFGMEYREDCENSPVFTPTHEVLTRTAEELKILRPDPKPEFDDDGLELKELPY